MKMIYGGVPVNSMKVKHYEISTNDCDMVASDLQAGKTAVAKGRKITGTGKSFEFAWYGGFETNETIFIPNMINVIEITSVNYPIQHIISLSNMKNIDFTVEQTIGNLVSDGTSYPITIAILDNHFLTISCDINDTLQVFYGKDNYV